MLSMPARVSLTLSYVFLKCSQKEGEATVFFPDILLSLFFFVFYTACSCQLWEY
jgi:hypothetical protein